MTKPSLRHRRRIPIGLFLPLAVAALSVAGAPTATTLPASARGPEVVKAYADLVAHLASERMEGRAPGTKGIDLARDFLVRQFTDMGLKPAFGQSYLQPFEIAAGVRVKDQSLAVLDGQGKPAEADARREFVALGFSRSGEFEGPAVFAGYGIVAAKRQYDSYAALGKDALRGKVVIAYRFEPQDEKGRSRWAPGRGQYGAWSAAASLIAKARWAAERGAAALLVVNPPGQNAAKALRTTAGTAFAVPASIPVVHISPGLFKKLLARAGRKDGDAAMKALRAAADAGEGKSVPLNGVVVRGRVRLERVRVEVHNVAGVLAGAGDLADEVVVVGAHYDHVGRGEFGSRSGRGGIHFGADDNASGTAGVVMLAKRFCDRAAGRDVLGGAPARRRSMVFVCFTAEERGLLGSRHFADHLEDMGVQLDQVAAMVNFDMIGRVRNRKLQIWGVESGDRWGPIVDAAVEGRDLDVSTSGLGIGPSDQASFYRRKVPVLGFFTGIHKDYHTPGDTAEKINAAGAVEVLAVAESVLAGVWTDLERIAYKPPSPAAGRAAMAMATDAYLGIVPDASSEAKGCAISVAVADGPAGRAGLKAGDAIVGWDERTIDSLEELLVALHASRPGQAVTLKVRRGEKTLTLEVTLGRRS